MKKTVNLNEEFREWINKRVNEVLAEDPENMNHVVFNLNEAKEDIFRLFYSYQVKRGWNAIATNTANILGVDRKTVYRKRK